MIIVKQVAELLIGTLKSFLTGVKDGYRVVRLKVAQPPPTACEGPLYWSWELGFSIGWDVGVILFRRGE